MKKAKGERILVGVAVPRRKRKPVVGISISLYRHDCGDSMRQIITAEDLDLIAGTFSRAAEAVRRGEHGSVEAAGRIAAIDIDAGGPYLEDGGLPLLALVRRERIKTRGSK